MTKCLRYRKKLKKFVFGLFVFLLAVLLCQSAYAASITLSPTSGFSSIIVVGTGFTPGNNLTMFWDANEIPTILSPLLVGLGGSFTALINVPTQTEPGSHVVTAKDFSTGVNASAKIGRASCRERV